MLSPQSPASPERIPAGRSLRKVTQPLSRVNHSTEARTRAQHRDSAAETTTTLGKRTMTTSPSISSEKRIKGSNDSAGKRLSPQKAEVLEDETASANGPRQAKQPMTNGQNTSQNGPDVPSDAPVKGLGKRKASDVFPDDNEKRKRTSVDSEAEISSPRNALDDNYTLQNDTINDQENELPEKNVEPDASLPLIENPTDVDNLEEPATEMSPLEGAGNYDQTPDATADLAVYGWPCNENDDTVPPSTTQVEMSSPFSSRYSNSYLTDKPANRSILTDLLQSAGHASQRSYIPDRKKLFEAVFDGDCDDDVLAQAEEEERTRQSTSRLYHHHDAIDEFFTNSNIEDNISTERLSSTISRKGKERWNPRPQNVRPGYLTPYPRFLTAEYFQNNGPRSCQSEEEVLETRTPSYPMIPHLEHKYTVTGYIGSGEFAEVLQVLDQETSTLFAVKRTKKTFRSYEDRWQQILEVDLMRSVCHSKHCIQLIDAWEEAGHLYLLMELCSSGSLKDYISRHEEKIAEDMIWHILYEITKGLKDIHDANILHLDLKPSNILLDENGFLKIGDFGHAVREPVNEHWVKGEGDRRYMAPDLLRDQYHKPADIFSLGLIILEMATLIELPDTGERWELLRLGDLSDYEQDLEHVSSDLRALVLQLLSSDSNERPTVDEILAHPRVCPRLESGEEKGALFDFV